MMMPRTKMMRRFLRMGETGVYDFIIVESYYVY
jgi:hypothetical protein